MPRTPQWAVKGAQSLPTPALAGPVSAEAEPQPLARGLFLLYLFLVYSRAHEYFLHIPKLMFMLGGLTLVVAIVSVGAIRLFQSRFGILLCAFGLSMMFTSVFSLWRAGSVHTFYGWLAVFLIFCAGVQVLTSPKALRSAMYAISWATLFMVSMLLIYGTTVLDRVKLSIGSMADPNDFASIILFSMPGWFLMILASREKLAYRIFAYGSLGLSIFTVLRTGSRAGFLTLAVLVLGMLRTVPAWKKLIAAASLLVLAILGSYMLPESVMVRYKTLFESNSDPVSSLEEGAARGSTKSRMFLLKQSIKITFQHPLLGVGIGQFVLANNEDMQRQGLRPVWQGTHNSYTEVSSEMGIPAFLIYVSILIAAFRVTGRVHRQFKEDPDRKMLADTAYCIRLSVLSYCITSLFLGHAYHFFMPTLAVLADGLQRVARRQNPGAGFIPRTAAPAAPVRPALLRSRH